jgi:hypothetical protein
MVAACLRGGLPEVLAPECLELRWVGRTEGASQVKGIAGAKVQREEFQ